MSTLSWECGVTNRNGSVSHNGCPVSEVGEVTTNSKTLFIVANKSLSDSFSFKSDVKSDLVGFGVQGYKAT